MASHFVCAYRYRQSPKRLHSNIFHNVRNSHTQFNVQNRKIHLNVLVFTGFMAIKSRANKRHHLFIARTGGIKCTHSFAHAWFIYAAVCDVPFPNWTCIRSAAGHQFHSNDRNPKVKLSILLFLVFRITFIEIVHFIQVLHWFAAFHEKSMHDRLGPPLIYMLILAVWRFFIPNA